MAECGLDAETRGVVAYLWGDYGLPPGEVR